MSKTSTSRVAKLRSKAAKKGLTRREYYATAEEHENLKAWLKAQRAGDRVVVLPPAIKVEKRP